MKRIVSLTLCMLMVAALLAGCGSQKPRTTWVIAVDGDFSPFVYADADGKAAGLDVEILDAIARDQNFRYELHPSDWDTAMGVFTSHQAQVLMGSIASSQDRIDGGWYFSQSFYDGVTQSMAMEPSRNMKQSWNLWSSSILNLPKPIPTAPLSMKIVPDIRYNVALRSWYAPIPKVEMDRPTENTATVMPVDQFLSQRSSTTERTRVHTADRSGDSSGVPVMA